MANKYISFTTHNMRKIIDGEKTETRRVIKSQPKVVHGYLGNGYWATEQIFANNQMGIKCPYGKGGGELYCREAYTFDTDGSILYAADHMDDLHAFKWKQRLFMPVIFCRVVLQVTTIRAERLSSITEEDCFAEGIEFIDDKKGKGFTFDNGSSGFFPTAKHAYFAQWQKIHKKTEDYQWENNPYVWVINFNAKLIKT